MGLAIVTGASRGIGRVLALRLATEGNTVACIARSTEDLESLAAEHRALLPVSLDLADEAATRQAIQALLAEHGPCELLVNNAGYGLRSAIEDVPLDRWRHEFEVNLFAATHLIQLVLPGMREARRGTIVNISSVAGRVSTPFTGAYSATKFALEAVSDSLRVEVREWGIHVVLVEPGPVATNFRAAALESSDGVLDAPDSPYRSRYAVYLDSVKRMHAQAWTAEQVVDKTMRAIHANHPPHRVACYGLMLRVAIAIRALSPAFLDPIVARQTGS